MNYNLRKVYESLSLLSDSIDELKLNLNVPEGYKEVKLSEKGSKERISELLAMLNVLSAYTITEIIEYYL